ncbi:MAG: hypothetical protein QOF36_1965 [Microbacteriaceae bacterium]|nr:hypothetical protein [Microbacteriaceae bacterium]
MRARTCFAVDDALAFDWRQTMGKQTLQPDLVRIEKRSRHDHDTERDTADRG